MLRLRNVSLVLGKKEVLKNVSLDIPPQGNISIIGESGSGKTLLLELLIGMRCPTKGVVEVDGTDLMSVPEGALPLYRRRLGIMLHDRLVLPDQTAIQNIAFPLSLQGLPSKEARSRAVQALDALGIRSLENDRGQALSKGEASLVALARASVGAPLIILLDEPFDGMTEMEMQRAAHFLKTLHASGKTIVSCGRSMDLAMRIGSRCLKLANGILAEEPAATSTEEKAPDLNELARSALAARGKLHTQPIQRKIRVTSINS
jgi:ABC-type ATPase involved in cell division